MPEENNGDMGRREFLKCATILAAPFLIPDKSLLATNPEPAKGEVYKKAKKVYDLAKEVWHPERENYRIYGSGVTGILNLASTGPDYFGPGYYLNLRRCDIGNRTQLDLIAVGYIDKETTKEIDKCLANLGLIHTPIMQGIDPILVEQIHQEVDIYGGITSTNVAVYAIWVDKILGYARKHRFPVLELCSMDLTSLYCIGVGDNGETPSYSDGTLILLEERYIPQDVLNSIISNKYVPLLTQAVAPLEREIERVNHIRSDKLRVATEKMLEAQTVLERRRRLESRQDASNNKLSEKPASLVQKILEYPIY